MDGKEGLGGKNGWWIDSDRLDGFCFLSGFNVIGRWMDGSGVQHRCV